MTDSHFESAGFSSAMSVPPLNNYLRPSAAEKRIRYSMPGVCGEGVMKVSMTRQARIASATDMPRCADMSDPRQVVYSELIGAETTRSF
jgi:hypothetical protein